MSHHVAIIPARSGSKRLKNKNLKILGNKSLICWTIDAALRSTTVDRVIVTTNCLDIKETAQAAGAEVPFIRPQSLAQDNSTTTDVIMHASETLGLKDDDVISILQPTSPFRTEQHIDEAFALLHSKHAEGIVSITTPKHHPLWSNALPEDGCMQDFIKPSILNKRSQDLPQYYSLNGAIYLYKVNAFYREKGIFYSSRVFGYKMSPDHSLDIEDKYDFITAQTLLSENF